MFAFPNTRVSYRNRIRQQNPPMPPMSQPDGLSELQERVLLAVWKLGSIGQKMVEESTLKAELSEEPQPELGQAIDQLRKLGFLDQSDAASGTKFSLTPLGLALLRKIEEDKLQELK